jgi:hypothetical protein
MIAAGAPPVDNDGIPLGHDPACPFWLRINASLSPPVWEVIEHRSRCLRCMGYAEQTARQVRQSGYVIPR